MYVRVWHAVCVYVHDALTLILTLLNLTPLLTLTLTLTPLTLTLRNLPVP